MSFDNPKAFADHIRTSEHEYAAEAEDLAARQAALRDRYAQEIADTGYQPERDFSPTRTAYQEVIEMIAEAFYTTLSQKLATAFRERFSFSTIDNRRLNASIRRSADGRFYAVLVNSTLITAMARLGKLDYAILHPDQVHSCSRFPGKPGTHEQYREIQREVYAHFLATKLPLGPQLLLNNPLNQVHLTMLGIKENLIVYHEIAHFLNGDLEPGAEQRPAIAPFPNAAYQREHLADIVGTGLLLRQMRHQGTLDARRRYQLILALIELFQLQHDIQGIETERYPHPLNRMSVVISKFYGAATEEWVARAILDQRPQDLAIEHFAPDLAGEALVLGYIEQQLNTAFAPSP